MLDSISETLSPIRSLARAFEHVAVGFCISDGSGHCLEANPSFCRILGYSLDELKTLNLIELVHPDDQAENSALMQSMIEDSSDEKHVIKNRFVKRDGEGVWVRKSMSLVKDDSGRRVWIMIVENIDDRIRAREHWSPVQMQMAQGSARCGFWEWDLETGTDYWSEEAWRLNGMEPGKIKPSHEEWLNAIHPDDRQRAGEHVLEAGKTGSEINVEWRVANIKPTRYLQARGGPIRNEAGAVVRYLGFLIDITAQKKIEAELQLARDAADAANRAKSDFLANMSHEIRTPLTSIMGLAQLLNRPGQREKQRFEYFCEIILRNSQLLIRLINDVLDLSKIEAGKIELEILPVSLRELLSDVASSMRFLATNRGLEFSMVIAEGVPERILIDPTRFKQILLNIVGNAIKFTKIGKVSIEVRMTPERGNLLITVTDTGIGLTEQQAQKLFEPFVQADASTTREFGGTGLGLVLARRCAEALGGDVRLLSSQPGGGCKFGITLELKEVQSNEAAAIPIQSQPEVRIDGVRVLMVEDTPDIQVLLREFITMAGGIVDIAQDGVEALQKASADRYDIVLMDIGMPNMDGYTATRLLRERNISVPIVALTAHSMREEIQRCLESGCNAHLSKPVQYGDLVDSIQRLTGRRPA